MGGTGEGISALFTPSNRYLELDDKFDADEVPRLDKSKVALFVLIELWNGRR